jgi:hypothetical protein
MNVTTDVLKKWICWNSAIRTQLGGRCTQAEIQYHLLEWLDEDLECDRQEA